MKIRKFILILPAFFLLSITSFAQDVYNGKITQVVDGRTIVLTAQNGIKTTLLMDNIEVPEPEQQFSKVVKEHLETLVLGKDARFSAQSKYSQGFNGKLFIGEVEINKQMLRDGAAWYNLPEKEFAPDSNQYLEMESLAKTEKRGVWGIDGLKPAWQFRQEQYAKKIEEINKIINSPRPIIYPSFPSRIQNTSFIDAEAPVPNNFVVVGVGYADVEKKKILQVIKKPQVGDLICAGYKIPAPFIVSYSTVSEMCPKSSVGSNANSIEDGRVLGKAKAMAAYRKAILAYRMYKISGNYNEFAVKAGDAVDAVEEASAMMEEGDFKTYLLLAIDALKDCMLVRNSRDGDLGSRLGGTALIALNEKYGLNDVYEGFLADEIYKVGVRYMNKATDILK